MLKIDDIGDSHIKIRQNSLVDVDVPSIFFASIGNEEPNMVTISPKETGAYRSFSDLLENIEINGVNGSSFTAEEAVKKLNSFIANFRKGGSSSGNNGNFLEKGDSDDIARVVMNGELIDPQEINVAASQKKQLLINPVTLEYKVFVNPPFTTPTFQFFNWDYTDERFLALQSTQDLLTDNPDYILRYSTYQETIGAAYYDLIYTPSSTKIGKFQFNQFSTNGLRFEVSIVLSQNFPIILTDILMDVSFVDDSQVFIQKMNYDSPTLPSGHDAKILVKDETDNSLKTVLKSKLNSNSVLGVPDLNNPISLFNGDGHILSILAKPAIPANNDNGFIMIRAWVDGAAPVAGSISARFIVKDSSGNPFPIGCVLKIDTMASDATMACISPFMFIPKNTVGTLYTSWFDQSVPSIGDSACHLEILWFPLI